MNKVKVSPSGSVVSVSTKFIRPRTRVGLLGSPFVWRVVCYYPVSDSYILSRGNAFECISCLVNSSDIKLLHTM